MADPYYGAAPRQESTVIRTNAEYDAMREARAAKIRAEALAAKKKAQEASGYNEFANRFKGAPSVAELMNTTGANAEEAVNIRRYQDWSNYAPTGGFGQQDLQTIQSQLNDPNRVAPGFQYKFSEPETAGQMMPYYKDWGNGDFMAPSLMMISGSGENPNPIGLGNSKDKFYQEAMGYGVGTAGLDAFAKNFGADNWQQLDWNSVQAHQNGDGTASYRSDPTQWGGDSFGVRGNGRDFAQLSTGGVETSLQDMPGTGYGLFTPQKDWFGAINQYRQDLKPIGAMNADFGNAMAQRDQNRIRSEQGYDQLTGFGFNGGLLNDSYSDPFFGQITGREATQSPFSMSEQGPYPWSTPTQQLDLASLMSPAYGGPNGMKSMGQYGGANSWGGQNRTGGLGGLGGFSSGPFGAKNPWSPA